MPETDKKPRERWKKPGRWHKKPSRPAVGGHPAPPLDDGIVRLYGLHAVEAALANPARRHVRLLATDNAVRRLAAAVSSRGLEPEPTTPRELDRMLGADTVHQGVLLETEPLPELPLADLARKDAAGGPVIVLDHVTDPHNVGAIL